MSTSVLHRASNHLLTLLCIFTNDSLMNGSKLLLFTMERLNEKSKHVVDSLIVNNVKHNVTNLASHGNLTNDAKHSIAKPTLGSNPSKCK